MPLTIPGMAAAIEAALAAPQTSPAQFSLALATAIVTYLKANATVLPTALIAPTGGGPVTGVGTIT